MVTANLNHGFRVLDESDIGRKIEGTVGELGTQAVIYEPNEAVGDVVLATGLLSTPGMYDVAGNTALKRGYRVVIFGHDHRYHKWPIRANTAEIIAASRELGLSRVQLAGHSMGTVASLLALEDDEFADIVESLVLFNPPMFGRYSLADMKNAAKEFARLGINHTEFASEAASTGALEILRRPFVIAKQMGRLGLGRVDERLQELTGRHPYKPITYVFNADDGVVPRSGEGTLNDMNVDVLKHRSPLGLAHFALCLDRTSAEGMIDIIEGRPLGPEYTKVSERTTDILEQVAYV